MTARNRHSNSSDFPALIHNSKFSGGVMPQNIAGAPIAIGRQTESFDPAKRLADYVLQFGRFAPGQNPSAPRHKIHETAKLQRDRREVGVDIRVIEFERREDQLVWMVVKELRT